MDAKIFYSGDNSDGLIMNGLLREDDNNDWIVEYSSSSFINSEELNVSGEAIWKYDEDISDHINMDFRQTNKFGSNSWWHWAVGAEIAFGITAGSVVSIIEAPTGPIAIASGIKVGLAATGAAFTFSKIVKESVDSETEPQTPELTAERPEAPADSSELGPEDDKIVIVIDYNNETIEGHGPYKDFHLSGKFSKEDGTFEATVDVQQ